MIQSNIKRFHQTLLHMCKMNALDYTLRSDMPLHWMSHDFATWSKIRVSEVSHINTLLDIQSPEIQNVRKKIIQFEYKIDFI